MQRVLAELPAFPGAREETCLSQPKSLWQLPAPQSPPVSPRAGPCLKARANPQVSTGDFFGDGGVKSKQVGSSGREGQVTSIFPPLVFPFLF